MKSKIYTLLIALVIFISNTWGRSVEYEGIRYGILDYPRYSASVTSNMASGYPFYNSDYSGSVTISATINYNDNQYDVISIAARAFQNCTSLISVNLPNSIRSIGVSAFYGCTNLISINLPNSITDILYSAFYGCRSLKNVDIPSSVTSIGDNTFRSCTSLTSIDLPNSITSIGQYAFAYCHKLTEVTMRGLPPIVGSPHPFTGSNLTVIYVPSNLVDEYRNNSGWSEYSSIIRANGESSAYCIVTFNSQGGSEVASANVLKNTPLTEPTPPIYMGRIFTGWYKDSACKNKWYFNDNVTADMTLYAGWTTMTTEVSIEPSELQLEIGNSAILSAIVTPADAADKSIVWSSMNPEIASVSVNGTVTALSSGSAVIIAATADGNAMAACVVTVIDSQPQTVAVTGVTISPSTLRLNVGSSTTLSATILPTNATNKAMTWLSSNSAVVSVSNNGTITAYAAGNAVVFVTTVDGNFTSVCNIIVTEQGTANESVSERLLIVYPNPTNGIITIDGLTFGATLYIYSSAGRYITNITASAEKMTLDLSYLSSGIYYLSVEGKTAKIVVK